jgi:orotate phosphoribosyltransferase
MNSDQILKFFEETNALLDGHFILSSGRHSPKYLQCALALQFPFDAGRFGRAIAEQFTGQNIETVASPAIGGLVIGYAVAAALNVRFIWTERENTTMTLRRGFTVKSGERILVVEDVITTGGSTRECISALESAGANVVGAASVIDRSNGEADVGVPRIALASLSVPSYSKEDCPLCAAGIPPSKPGSRTQPAGAK